jgi:hypothetical protein
MWANAWGGGGQPQQPTQPAYQAPQNWATGLYGQYQGATDQAQKDAMIRAMQGSDQGAAFNAAMKGAGYGLNPGEGGGFNYTAPTAQGNWATDLYGKYQGATDQAQKDAFIQQMQGGDQSAAFNQAMKSAGYTYQAGQNGAPGSYAAPTPPPQQPQAQQQPQGMQGWGNTMKDMLSSMTSMGGMGQWSGNMPSMRPGFGGWTSPMFRGGWGGGGGHSVLGQAK